MDKLLAGLKHSFGPEILNALDDPEIIEIMLNPDGGLWMESLGRPMEHCGYISQDKALLILGYIASSLSTTVTVERPIVEGELPYFGCRFEGIIPPIVEAPTFSIRKPAGKVFTLEDYVSRGIMDISLLPIIHEAVEQYANIIVVGGTGSGKTTFINAIIDSIAKICPDDRLTIIEDTKELQSKSRNTVFLRTSDFVNTRRLVKVVMRLRPTRILIGEVRDETALDLLKAWNTGHPGGVSSVHANSAEEGIYRIEELVAEATSAPKQRLISMAIQLIIYIERTPSGRKVSQVIRMKGFDSVNQQYKLERIYGNKKI
ncbi:MAG: P-type conjugative transfer ATPase TrbB [Desulfarculales bacterium]|jgi:type IV secretion system protein VirB11|nr:P-type conjugative transfer ATPase TrbB [Desulfarculales bacterium]